MILLEPNKLKKYILENLVQEEIIAVFLGVSESDIAYCLAHKSNKIKNPLREDKRASLGMMWVTDSLTNLPKIRMWDFGEPFYRGDCFDLVGWVSTLSPNNKKHFVLICKAIISYGNREVLRKTPGIVRNIVIAKHKTAIEVQVRNFNNYDTSVWAKWGITIPQLITEFCYPVQYAWINSDVPNYTYTTRDPCYAYYIGRDITYGNVLYQLYFPLRKKTSYKSKFITNSSYSLLDISPFNKRLVLILVKSKKDKLTILAILAKFKEEIASLLDGITIELRSISSENPSITREQNKILQNHYSYIFIYTDFDRAGRQTSYFYKKEFGYYPLYITNGYMDTINHKAKDISDYRSAFGEEPTLLLLKQAVYYIVSIVNTDTNFITNLAK